MCDDIEIEEMRNSDSVSVLATRGRHLGISLATAVQSATMLHPTTRKNVDYLFVSSKVFGSDLDTYFQTQFVYSTKKTFTDAARATGEHEFAFSLFYNVSRDSRGSEIHVFRAKNIKLRVKK